MNTTNLLPALEKFLHQRKDPLNDVTELFALKELAPFAQKVFYTPAISDEKSQPLYLADIFTVHTASALLDPWTLSLSVMELLQLSRKSIKGKNASNLMSEFFKNFRKTSTIKDLWSTYLTKIYGKELQSLPKTIESELSTLNFEPKILSVMVLVTSGSTTQRLVAIVERKRTVKPNSTSRKTDYTVVIKRLYWI